MWHWFMELLKHLKDVGTDDDKLGLVVRYLQLIVAVRNLKGPKEKALDKKKSKARSKKTKR